MCISYSSQRKPYIAHYFGKIKLCTSCDKIVNSQSQCGMYFACTLHDTVATHSLTGVFVNVVMHKTFYFLSFNHTNDTSILYASIIPDPYRNFNLLLLKLSSIL